MSWNSIWGNNETLSHSLSKGEIMGLVVAENITKVYSVVATKVSKDYTAGEIAIRALNEVSFEIESASFVSFVGPSGSGKTTLLNLFGCLDKPTEGKLTVADTDVLHLD